MESFLRTPAMILSLVLCAAAVAVAGQATPFTSPPLTPGDMEAFLLKAKIVAVREAGIGVTGSLRATLTDGTLTHDVHIQSVDVTRSSGQKAGFTDSYRFNIAGYRLARLLGIEVVPMSVEREMNGEPASFTWWVDDVLMDERERLERKTLGPNPARTANQFQLMHIWDELIQNADRNQGNILWTKDWTMRLIDHTQAFRLGDKLLKPDELMRIDRRLLARLKGLTRDGVALAVGESLQPSEQEALLQRRDRIVTLFEERAARVGDTVVYVDF